MKVASCEFLLRLPSLMFHPHPLFERPADSFVPQKDRELLRLELYMAKRINEERAALGLSVLVGHALLAAVARAHSAEMRDHSYFAHESPSPKLHSPADRYEYAFGAAPRFVSENIACRRSSSSFAPEDAVEKWIRNRIGQPLRPAQGDVEGLHQGLMNSSGQRANILEPTLDLVGIGLVSRNRDLWVTQVFAWR